MEQLKHCARCPSGGKLAPEVVASNLLLLQITVKPSLTVSGGGAFTRPRMQLHYPLV